MPNNQAIPFMEELIANGMRWEGDHIHSGGHGDDYYNDVIKAFKGILEMYPADQPLPDSSELKVNVDKVLDEISAQIQSGAIRTNTAKTE